MNKTIIININGIVFHIEEDAYEILKNYMTDVKRHFLNSADSLEITTDIENRVAEMFSELLTAENKQVIVETDVQNVITQMGRVEDFDEILDESKLAGSSAYPYNTGERKLFRDPDNRLVSGVCAGIANYFNIDPVWIRLAFGLSFFFAGSGLLLYIILWIVIPEAVTRADRMAMQGEKLNLQGFKNNLEGELSSVKNHLNNLQHEAKPFLYNLRNFMSDFFHHLGIFFAGAGKIFIKLIGIVILIGCFAMAIGLIITLIAFLGFGAGHYNHMFPFTIVEYAHANRIYISAFLTAFIPVLCVILLLIGAIFNTRGFNRSYGSTILVIWLCSLGIFIFYASKAAANFRREGSFSQTTLLKATPGNVYYLKFNDVKYLTHDDSLRLDIKGRFNNMMIRNDDDNPEPENVRLYIEKSDTQQPELIETYRARGRNDEDALLNARNTKYIFIQQDSVLKFDDMLRRLTGDAWHEEEIDLTLRVPLNAKVVIDQQLQDRINLDGVNVYDCKTQDKKETATAAAFIMTDSGLQCNIDTVITPKNAVKADSARKTAALKTIAQLKARIDSVKRVDSLNTEK